MTQDPVKIIALGGLGEIGLNMLVIEYRRQALILDAGIMFPKQNVLGIEFLIPQFDYITQPNLNILGYCLSHGHEDHIGALPYIIPEAPAPIFGSPFTIALTKQRLQDRRKKGACAIEMHAISDSKMIEIGPFQVQFIPTSHSILGARALHIKTPAGTLLHSGDFKLDQTTPEEDRLNPEIFQRLGREGIDLLLSDSTNVLMKGHSITELEVYQKMENIFRGAPSRILVGIFSSHIQRIQQILFTAQRTKKRVLLLGKSLLQNVRIAREMGYLNIPPQVLIQKKDLKKYKDNQICIISTGSQGEIGAVLPRLAVQDVPEIQIQPDDTIILGTRIIPGNESAVYQMINQLNQMGADVFYGDYSDLQSSGHAYQNELETFLKWIQPKFFIPIHGEYRHLLAHAKIAQNTGINPNGIHICKNGDIIEWHPDQIKISKTIEAGKIWIQSNRLENTRSSALRERRKLARHGIVSALFQSHGDQNHLVDIKCIGISQHCNDQTILNDLQKILTSIETVELSQLELEIRSYFKKNLGRTPTIVSHCISDQD